MQEMTLTKVLIVAKCIVNIDIFRSSNVDLNVLIVAKCIVNAPFLFLLTLPYQY